MTAKQARILIVEDELYIAQSIQHHLEKLGYEIIAYISSGEQAVQMVRETEPDLVLMDIQLQGSMDGVEAATHIHEYTDIPIIYITAYANEELLQRVKMTSPFGYILKPFQERELYAVIETTLYKYRVDKAARQSDARYRQLFKTMTSGVAVYEAVEQGADFIFKDFNPAAEQIEDISKSDILGKRVTEVFPNIRDFGLFEVFQQVWQDGEPQYHPTKYYQDERIAGWRENYVYKLPSGEIVTLYNDTTERKQAEAQLQQALEEALQAKQALQESETRFRQLAENINQVFWIGSLDWNTISYISPAYESVWGLSCADIYKNPRAWLSSIIEEDRPAVLDTIKKKIQPGVEEITFPEYRIQRPDGTVRWILARAYPIGDADQNIQRIVGLAEDITERKRTEASLRREHTLLTQVMETSPIAITVVNREGQITYANAKAQGLLELTKKEITDRTYNAEDWHITTHDGQPLADKNLPFYQVITTGEPVYDVLHAIHTKDGRRKLLSVNAAPLLDKHGHVEGIVSAIEDVTERVQEKQRRQQQLEQELQALALLSAPQNSSVTAHMFGLTPLRKNLPDIFDEMLQAYKEIINLALEQQIYKVKHPISERLRTLAQRLGTLRAGPRDVVELHSATLKASTQEMNPVKAKAYAEEGRLIALELMGYLTTYYRYFSMGSHGVSSR